MMLNLVGQVTCQKVKPFAAFDIARAKDLAYIPVAFTFIGIEMGIDMRLLSEMPTKNHRPRL